MNLWRKLRQHDKLETASAKISELNQLLNTANLENTDLLRRLETARTDAHKTGRQSQFLMRFIAARHEKVKEVVSILAVMFVAFGVFGQPFQRNPYDTNNTTAADARVSSLAATAAQAATNGFGWTNLPVPFASTARTATNAPNGKFLADTNMVNTASNAVWVAANSFTNAAGIVMIVTNAGTLPVKVGNAVLADTATAYTGSIANSQLPATLTNKVSQASFTDFANTGTNVVISPTNGNLQSWVLTNVSWAAMDAANTNWTETLRLNVYGSNTLTWTTTTLSNSAVLGPSNSCSSMLFDHERNTNLWWGYRLR